MTARPRRLRRRRDGDGCSDLAGPAATVDDRALVIAVAATAFAAAGIPPVPFMWRLCCLRLVLPSCGLTQGVVALTRGDLAAAWQCNPESPLTEVAAAAGVLRAAVASVVAALGRHAGRRSSLVNQWDHAAQLMGRA